jgi:hypothetical protein
VNGGGCRIANKHFVNEHSSLSPHSSWGMRMMSPGDTGIAGVVNRLNDLLAAIALWIGLSVIGFSGIYAMIESALRGAG